MNRRRWCLVSGAAVLVAGPLAGCGTQHPTVAELQAVPGATSSYPGSVAVGGHGASEGEHTLVNSSGAMLFTTYCTGGSQPDVSRWFASELDGSGWKAEPNPVGTAGGDVVSTEEWQRGARRFTLQLLSSAYVARLSATENRPCSTGYRTVVQ